MTKLLLLFISVPLLEMALLIEIGGRIGTLNTVGLIVLTGILGAALARRQGLGVLRQMQAETAEGRLPAGSIGDGVLILLAAALLITPGILTDAFGFLCLIPTTRRQIRSLIWRQLKRAVRQGQVTVFVDFGGNTGPSKARKEEAAEDQGDSPRRLPDGRDDR